MLLYRGFAEGCISLVAPTAGLVAVLVPVLASLALFDRPSDLRVIGLLMAALSVVLLGGSTGARSRARFSLAIGTLSGLGYGSADLALGVLPAEDMPGSICIIRLVATLCALAVLVGVRFSRAAAGQPRIMEMARTRMGWDAVCLAAAAGLLDALGHQGFALSAASGQVALAAALTALHPLVSIVLSVVVLRDRIGRVQMLGSLTSIASMALLVA
jgi:drug/metabolite transporter (DMT)-like permease